jgi:hypothetical protein
MTTEARIALANEVADWYYERLTQCCDKQLDQVFGSLDELDRTETLRRLAQEITNRYQESSGLLSIR